jgi:hypothetical protein
MRLLITGRSGFIGSHLGPMIDYLTEGSDAIIVEAPRRKLDLTNASSDRFILESLRPTHVLHLAWASTSLPDYDVLDVHSEWAIRTFSLAESLSRFGVVNWIVGTGLEDENMTQDPTHYGLSKLKLKRDVLDFQSELVRWISMPYVFSLFHKRPRITEAIQDVESLHNPDSVHDYLELRDVVFQLGQIIDADHGIHSRVTSGRRISNFELVTKLSEVDPWSEMSSCSCQLGVQAFAVDSVSYTSQFLKW